MSHATVQVLHIDTPAMPRGAILVDLLFSAITGLFRAAQARKPTRSEEAASVRAMAFKLQDTDPGFASDLMMAASRHESLDDEPATSRR